MNRILGSQGVPVLFLTMLIMGIVGVSQVFGGADSTFDTLSAPLQAWLEGSLGDVIALVGFIVGIAVAASGSFMVAGASFLIALAAVAAPTIITGITTGVM